MEDPHLSEQDNGDTTARPFADLPAQLLEQGLDVPPGQGAADGSGKDQLKGALVPSPHSPMVLVSGTGSWSAEAPA